MCDTFSHLVFNVSKMLTKDDLDAVAYLYRLPVDPSVAGSSTNGLLYLRELEKRDIFSSANLNGLKLLLNNIQRSDLIELVEEFEKERLKYSRVHQRYTRPHEESIRLDMSYTQAKKTKQQLAEFQKEFTSFCSRLGDAPGMKQFYGGMLHRLREMKDSCQQYIVAPLHEIIHFSYLTPTHIHHGGVQGTQQYLIGKKHCYESQNPHQPAIVAVSGFNASVVGDMRNQRNLDHLTSIQGHAVYSPNVHRTQTTTPIRVGLATTHSQLPQTHSSSSFQNKGKDTVYDVLSPIVIATEQPQVRGGSTDGICTLAKDTERRTANRSHSTSPNRLSSEKMRQQSGKTLSHHTTERRRTSNSSSAVSVTITPSLKRTGSVDNVLHDQSFPSRIPKLHQLFYYKGKPHSSPSSSTDLSSGSSYCDSDFSGSTDSGIEIRTNCAKPQQSSSDMSRLDFKTTVRKDRGYAKLNKQSLEAPPIYQRPRKHNSK